LDLPDWNLGKSYIGISGIPWSRGHGILFAFGAGFVAGRAGSPSFSFSEPIVGF